MSRVICITTRKLAEGSFLQQIRKIAAARPEAIILREKDLGEKEYENLAVEVLNICREEQVNCIFHAYPVVALKYQPDGIHLPLPQLRKWSHGVRGKFSMMGSSVHSVEEALEAEELGVTYITAGHIFATDCKKGVAPRGLLFLGEVCNAVTIPVYALGGIHISNGKQCLQAGAAGVCMMSELMKSHEPNRLIDAFGM